MATTISTKVTDAVKTIPDAQLIDIFHTLDRQTGPRSVDERTVFFAVWDEMETRSLLIWNGDDFVVTR
jgi:hypothetical protein